MAKKLDSTIVRVYDAVARTWTFNVKDPVKPDGFHGSLTLELGKLSREVAETALVDRMANRIIDAAAIPFEKNKRYATAQEKFDAMAVLVQHYNSGAVEWSIRPAGAQPRINLDRVLLFDALTLMRSDRTAEQIKAFVDGKSAAEIASILVSASVRPWADKVREQAAAGMDGEELLQGL